MKKLFSIALALACFAVGSAAQAGVISIVGSRSELNTIASAFQSYGDTVVRYNKSWNAMSAAELDAAFSSDIVWEGDIFSTISAGVQSRMATFIDNNGGLFLTGERPCCEGHNNGVEAVARAATGNNGVVVGDLGFDIYNHVFSNTPSTILTAPNDIRGQQALHNGPGRVSPIGGINDDACFIISDGQYCTAAAWGPDKLANNQGRLVVYGDINSQPSLVSQYQGQQFENIREFLLAGFSGGGDVCIDNPQLPGCQNVPVPAGGILFLTGLGLLGLSRKRLA